MDEGGSRGLARSRRDLEAARVLTSNGFAPQAISRAYFAAFYAAQGALEALNITRSKHSGVIAAIGQLTQEHALPKEAFDLLRSLFERRNRADYGSDQPIAERADKAIADADRFVDAVETWLRTHST